MSAEALSILSNVVSDILSASNGTSGAREAVQISLAPVFLLVAIGGVMNVMMTRLIWIAGRIERLEEDKGPEECDRYETELAWLRTRRLRARRAIMFSTAAGVTISILVALLFVATYIGAQIGSVIAGLWVLTMACLITGLIFFLLETRLAATGGGIKNERMK